MEYLLQMIPRKCTVGTVSLHSQFQHATTGCMREALASYPSKWLAHTSAESRMEDSCWAAFLSGPEGATVEPGRAESWLVPRPWLPAGLGGLLIPLSLLLQPEKTLELSRQTVKQELTGRPLFLIFKNFLTSEFA